MIVVITGDLHSGKTTLANELRDELVRRGAPVYGILSEAVFVAGERIGYDARAAASRKRFPLLRIRGKPSWARVGCYFLDPLGFSRASEALRNRGRGTLFIDEIGPLELEQRGGFCTALEEVLPPPPGLHLVVVVREKLLAAFLERCPKEWVGSGRTEPSPEGAASLQIVRTASAVSVQDLAGLLSS